MTFLVGACTDSLHVRAQACCCSSFTTDGHDWSCWCLYAIILLLGFQVLAAQQQAVQDQGAGRLSPAACARPVQRS
jgi:hypothetical protein